MWPDRVSTPGSLTYESGNLPTALRGPNVLVTGEKYDIFFTVENNTFICLRYALNSLLRIK